MDDRAVTFFISDREQAIIDEEIASGRYADDRAVMRAGLAALGEKRRLATLRDATIDDDAIFLRAMEALEADTGSVQEVDDVLQMKTKLHSAEASGLSNRQIPEIMANVKAKLRSHGAL